MPDLALALVSAGYENRFKLVPSSDSVERICCFKRRITDVASLTETLRMRSTCRSECFYSENGKTHSGLLPGCKQLDYWIAFDDRVLIQ